MRAINATLGEERVERIGYRVQIRPNSRRMVPVLVHTKKAGEAILQVSVVNRAYGDAQEVKIPMYVSLFLLREFLLKTSHLIAF